MADRHDAPLRKVPGLAEAVRRGFGKAIVFSGRASRAEFWLFVLFWFAVSLLLVAIWSAVFGPAIVTAKVSGADGSIIEQVVGTRYHSGWFGHIFNLICLIPVLSLIWRRLHDRNHLGWWALLPVAMVPVSAILAFIATLGPLATWQALTSGAPFRVQVENGAMGNLLMMILIVPLIYLLVQLVRGGTPGPNRFGPPPYRFGPDSDGVPA